MMIALQGDTIRFVLPDNRLLVARLVEGEFPDYRGVVPNPDAVKQIASVSAKQFAEALRVVSICSNERWHGVRLDEPRVSVSPANDWLTSKRWQRLLIRITRACR
jgi:DNA polymerase III sliding clamp (beta) subunit (PCNA family)